MVDLGPPRQAGAALTARVLFPDGAENAARSAAGECDWPVARSISRPVAETPTGHDWHE